ncbi:hypothetical protein [Paenibacillus sp. FSL R10-2771]|uniref:hypothetical protein n=1 Tax=Paenibacillus sp. FSL R10-2771 TaxID=2954693 RepID=UPI0030F738B1
MIFIACPEKYATGGTELLHQLYFKLRTYTEKVKMYYYNFSNSESPISPRFEKYQVSYVNKIEDSERNILIVPEMNTDLLKKFKNINKCIWWLSVDNYYKAIGKHRNPIKTIIIRSMNIIKKDYYFKKLVNFSDNKIIHLYQSFYAKRFLEKMGVKNSEDLSDYLGSNFLEEIVDYKSLDRINRVLYNPKKGIDFTNKIISHGDNLRFVPLINMSQEQIIELCRTSKIYIDFGNHPGKDRFPREATYLGCVVITGRKGSAKYSQDVMIPADYKFNDDIKLIPDIIEKINYVYDNYDKVINSFDDYRSKILNEENEFEKNVELLWEKHFKVYS